MDPEQLACTLNISISELHERCKPRIAVLKGYKRIFNKKSQQWIAALNLIKTDNPDDEVWGIIINVDEAEFKRIKCREKQYHLEAVEVLVCGEKLRAKTFISKILISSSEKPKTEYIQIVIKGAEYWNIKEQVLKNLYYADGSPYIQSI